MMKKMFLMAGAALFSTSLFCDILVGNQTGDTCYVQVEGVTEKLLPGAEKNFKVTLKDGKTMDGISYGSRDTMVKWVRAFGGVVPVVYRSKEIKVPKAIYLRPDGGSYITWTWTGVFDAPKEATGLTATEVSEQFQKDMDIIKERFKELGGLNYRDKNYAADASKIGSKESLDTLFQRLASSSAVK